VAEQRTEFKRQAFEVMQARYEIVLPKTPCKGCGECRCTPGQGDTVSNKKLGVLLRCWLLLSLLVAVLGHVPGVGAHESRPAFLGINETAPGRYDVL